MTVAEMLNRFLEALAASENAYRVTMDIPFDNDKSYFNDKMMIIDGVNFEKLFMQILEENTR